MTATVVTAPDPVEICGHGYVPDPIGYTEPPWKDWILDVRAELPLEEILTELIQATAVYADLRTSVIRMDDPRMRWGKKDRAEHFKKSLTDVTQVELAKKFETTKGTISRWLSATRNGPDSFFAYLQALEKDRLARADVTVSGLWLALCRDDLTEPDTVDLRLYQLWEWVVGEDLTPQKLSDLAGPLTPQAMARIEEALNTPIGELPAKV